MQRSFLSALALAGVMGLSSAAAVPAVEVVWPWELVDCSEDEAVRELTETFPDPREPGVTVTVHMLCRAALPPLEACSSDAYSLTGWAWSGKVSVKVDPTNSGLGANGVLSAMGSSGSAWDAATSGSIWGGATQNAGGANAGKRDGTNQVGFKAGGNYIAVTYTWSSGGNALESDQRYNTNYPWSLNGEANKMDVQNIATHEFGHTYGLGHTPTGSQHACLTMYPYADYGETQKRSLESGDKLGIKAIYG